MELLLLSQKKHSILGMFAVTWRVGLSQEVTADQSKDWLSPQDSKQTKGCE